MAEREKGGGGWRRGRGKGLRDEVELIMKRLRVPWREEVGGQVREREKRRPESQSQMETDAERERKGGHKRGGRGGGYLAIESE